MNVVKDVVNAMGGVDYDVILPLPLRPRDQEGHAAHGWSAGARLLPLAQGRQRRDVDRVDRQQRMLFKIFETMLATNQVKNIP